MAGEAKANETQVKWNDKRGVWEVRWTEQSDARSRSRAVSTGIKDRSAQFAAEVFKQEFITQQRVAELNGDEPRIRDVLRHYEADAKMRGVLRISNVIGRLDKTLGPFRLSALTSEDITLAMSKRGISQASIRQELQIFKAAIAFGHKTGFLDKDISVHVSLPKVTQGRLEFLDEQQESIFHALACGLSIGEERLTNLTKFICIGLDTGARRQAILDLTWDRVDFINKTIDFRKPGRFVSKKRRPVHPINARLFPVLQRAYKERSKRDDDHVIGPTDLPRAWRIFIAATPFPWMTPHHMRHTYATLMLASGVDITLVAELLADSPVTVWRTYSHVISGRLRDAADARIQKFMS
jgi:integrase